MKPILEVQNLAKKYRLRHESAGYLSIRERMQNIVTFRSTTSEDFWALKQISFDVQPGESIGIIGQNGAGKSTLLKILSKITPPTEGRIITRGRIASLLEVGTGFHPELTGRENIFFNGSLLGMKRKEIQAKFNEIVDFSGTRKFLDTPLKHYSSGMQLRLAFSVAAFLDPEILIIDEVLAVGDAEFQKKCLGKMEDVTNSGRTVLFVSHNLDAVEKLCKNSILLSKGMLIDSGPSNKLIAEYLSDTAIDAFQRVNLTAEIALEELTIQNKTIYSGEDLEFSLKLSKSTDGEFQMTDLCLLFYNYKKYRVAIYDLRTVFKLFRIEGNYIHYSGRINNFNLIEGQYSVGLFYGFNSKHGDLFDLAKVQVKNEIENQKVKPYDAQYRGYVDFSNYE